MKTKSFTIALMCIFMTKSMTASIFGNRNTNTKPEEKQETSPAPPQKTILPEDLKGTFLAPYSEYLKKMNGISVPIPERKGPIMSDHEEQCARDLHEKLLLGAAFTLTSALEKYRNHEQKLLALKSQDSALSQQNDEERIGQYSTTQTLGITPEDLEKAELIQHAFNTIIQTLGDLQLKVRAQLFALEKRAQKFKSDLQEYEASKAQDQNPLNT